MASDGCWSGCSWQCSPASLCRWPLPATVSVQLRRVMRRPPHSGRASRWSRRPMRWRGQRAAGFSTPRRSATSTASRCLPGAVKSAWSTSTPIPVRCTSSTGQQFSTLQTPTLQTPTPQSLSAPMRILLVEDEPTLQQQLKSDLQAQGYTVEATGEGKEALYFATEYPYDVAVVDLGLPGLSGLDIIRRLRAN